WDSGSSKCYSTSTLGVVLTVFLPDSPLLAPFSAHSAEIYPTTPCSGSCALVPVLLAGLPTGYRCPNGAKPQGGRCWVPVVDTPSKTPQCVVTDPGTRCFGSTGPLGTGDGRVYNKNLFVLTTEVPSAYKAAGETYQIGIDRSNRLMDGAFFRTHMASK